jgi:D-glycero-D-manno-heptose 1,7-bisphosphate phosphatase
MKLLLLDCDGTIRESKSGERFIKEPRDQVAIVGAVRAIKGYSDHKIYGITNQIGVGQGHKTLRDAIEEQLVTLELFPEIKEILFCPDRKGIDCYGVGRKYLISYGDRYSQLKGSFRKPNDGMI